MKKIHCSYCKASSHETINLTVESETSLKARVHTVESLKTAKKVDFVTLGVDHSIVQLCSLQKLQTAL